MNQRKNKKNRNKEKRSLSSVRKSVRANVNTPQEKQQQVFLLNQDIRGRKRAKKRTNRQWHKEQQKNLTGHIIRGFQTSYNPENPRLDTNSLPVIAANLTGQMLTLAEHGAEKNEAGEFSHSNDKNALAKLEVCASQRSSALFGMLKVPRLLNSLYYQCQGNIRSKPKQDPVYKVSEVLLEVLPTLEEQKIEQVTQEEQSRQYLAENYQIELNTKGIEKAQIEPPYYTITYCRNKKRLVVIGVIETSAADLRPEEDWVSRAIAAHTKCNAVNRRFSKKPIRFSFFGGVADIEEFEEIFYCGSKNQEKRKRGGMREWIKYFWTVVYPRQKEQTK